MKRFDLRPRGERRRAWRPMLLGACVVLGLLAVMPGLVLVNQREALRAQQDDLRTATADLAQAQQRVVALKEYADLHDRRVTMTRTAQALLSAGVPWAGFLEQLSLVVPDAVSLTGLSCVVPPKLLPGKSQTIAATTPDLTFTGTAWSHSEVARLLRRLALLPDITDVRLASAAEASTETTTAPSVVTFTITASLTATAHAALSSGEAEP